MRAALEAVGLVSGYGSARVLHGVDLTVAAGSVTALVGANGAGKTTTLRTLAGLLPVIGGGVVYEGADLSPLPAHERVARGLVLVPEGRLVFPGMTVEENLRVGASSPGARAATEETLAEVLELFPRLGERRRQPAGTLSGGEQQMLALGRGLMARPRLLLLDEPTLGLAPGVAKQVFEIVPTLVARKVTVLLAEQDVHRTLALADQAYVLENGRVTMADSGPALLAHPDIRRAYLGSGSSP